MLETPELNAPNQHPTLIEIIDLLGHDKISELNFENSEKTRVNFTHNQKKFNIELEEAGYGEAISLEVKDNDKNEELGFFNLSMFNFEEQIGLIVKTILNYD